VTPVEPALLYPTLVILPLLSIITLVIVTISPVYGHTFSENENSLFLTRIDQVNSQLKFIQNLLGSNTSSSNNPQNITQVALIHAIEAAGLLKVKDPVNNFTWTQEIAERNQRVATDLVRGFNDLTASLNRETSSKNNSNVASANGGSQSIQDKIFNLSGLLDEAVSTRVAKDIINNSTNQALILSNLGNEIFYSYGQALGFPYPKLIDMVTTMNMSAMGGASNSMNMHGNEMMQGMTSINANGNQTHNVSNKVNIVNETDYQNALAYVKQAQEIVSKYLKSPAPTVKTSTNIQPQLNKILSQLESTISSKGSFDNVMNLIHVHLHPTLISNYGLKLATSSSK
jgi:hypothetical protein